MSATPDAAARVQEGTAASSMAPRCVCALTALPATRIVLSIMAINKNSVQTAPGPAARPRRPAEDSWADLRRRLAGLGGRLTPQRMAIYEAVVGRTTHPSVATVHEEVRRRFPGISAATVYTTLDLLARLGLVQEVSGPVRRYDGQAGVHVNLVCSRCGQVIDVSDGELEALQRRAAARAGFRVSAVRFELHGLCPRCQRARHHGQDKGGR